MKILVLISANRNSWHYIVSDSVEAMKELGHEVVVIPVINRKDSIRIILRNLKELNPNFIFTANNVGLCPEVLDVVNIPILSWITTEPQVLAEVTPTKNLIPLVVGESYLNEMKNSGHSRVFLLPLAANPKVFKYIPLSDSDQKRYGCEISFAGGCNYDIWYKRHKEGIDRFFSQEVVEKLIARHSWDTSSSIIDHLILTLEELNRIRDGDREFLRNQLESKVREELIVLHWAAMSKFRKDVIAGIKDFGIELYGDEGWRGIEESPGISFHPFIENREELVKLYNATNINLNLPTSKHLNTSTFNIAVCGVFMLSSFNPELIKSFGNEIVYFKEIEELREKITYYLAHPDEREIIASNAQRRALEEHTFLHRMKRLIQIMESQ
ncbi:TPA: hypothetical protein DCX15_02445 [bacterium]|nr:hypothetical protein [bacterium]